MEEKDIKMMDAFVMQMLNRVTAFDMFAQAMVFVRAASEAGGTWLCSAKLNLGRMKIQRMVRL